SLQIATGLEEQGAGKTIVINDEGVIRWALQSPFVRQVQNGVETQRAKTLAVVGLSGNPARPSHRLAVKMKRLGYRIIPVNPKETEILGEKAYPDLASIPEPIDIVQVFRSPEASIEVAKEAAQLEKQPKIFWLQEGVISEEAARIAREAGLEVVHNR